MKATFNRSELGKALAACRRIVPSRTPKLILHCVKIVVKSDDTATIEVTDLETAHLRITLPCTDADPGMVAINAGLLSQYVNEGEGDALSIEADANNCTVKCGGEWEPGTEDADSFTGLGGEAEGEPTMTIEANELAKALSLTAFAVASESARYALTGINFDLSGNAPRMVATDGKRMAVRDLKCEAKYVKGDHVIPSPAITVLCSLATEPVQIRINSNDATFSSGGIFVRARKVEGRFPTYRDVFPKKTHNKLPINVGATIRHLRQAAVGCDEDSKGVVLTFEKGVCEMRANSGSRGRAMATMSVPDDVKFQTTFDPKLLLDMLSRLPGEDDVQMEHPNNDTVCLFTHGADYSYIVVPLSKAVPA